MRTYFAYGSNMDERSMASRCPHARAIGPAILRGRRFFITTNGWASVRPDDDSDVHGLLWTLSPADEEALDQWEDVVAGLYTKATLTVTLPGGDAVSALVYVETSIEEGAPAAWYIEAILAAAERLALPAGYVLELRRWA
jgi:gamma-glutamylcyclotransferase (GGCT)/AIG2-like uncharacterized protein YtfP